MASLTAALHYGENKFSGCFAIIESFNFAGRFDGATDVGECEAVDTSVDTIAP